MKILIDVTQIPRKKAGVGVYALNLVREVAALDCDNTYYILIQDDDHSLDSLERKDFVLIRVKSVFFRIFILRFLLMNFRRTMQIAI